MESLQDRFEKYLIDNHKEAIEKLICQRIEDFKTKPYYKSTIHSHGTRNTLTVRKTGSTIGEVCSKDYEIIQCFTNKRRQSVLHTDEYHYITVGDAINEEVNELIRELLLDYIESDIAYVCKELDIMQTENLDVEFLSLLAERDYIEPHLSVMYALSDLQGPIGKLFYNDQIHEYYERWAED